MVPDDNGCCQTETCGQCCGPAEVSGAGNSAFQTGPNEVGAFFGTKIQKDPLMLFREI